MRLVEASGDWERGFEGYLKGGERRGEASYADTSSENLQKMGEIPEEVDVVKELQNEDIYYSILICFLFFLLPPFPQEFN